MFSFIFFFWKFHVEIEVVDMFLFLQASYMHCKRPPCFFGGLVTNGKSIGVDVDKRKGQTNSTLQLMVATLLMVLYTEQ